MTDQAPTRVAGDSSAVLRVAAMRRYLHDAEFHAIAYRAVLVVQDGRGYRLRTAERDLAMQAASVALVLMEQNDRTVEA